MTACNFAFHTRYDDLSFRRRAAQRQRSYDMEAARVYIKLDEEGVVNGSGFFFCLGNVGW